jgi:hypothetical protein
MATCLSPPAEPPSRRLTPSTSMSSGTTTSSGPKQCQPVGEAMVDRRPRGRRVMCKATRLDEPLGDHGGPQGQDRGAVGADRQGWVHSWRACSCGSRKPIGGRTVLAGGPTQPRSVVMLSRDGVLGSRGRKSAVGQDRGDREGDAATAARSLGGGTYKIDRFRQSPLARAAYADRRTMKAIPRCTDGTGSNSGVGLDHMAGMCATGGHAGRALRAGRRVMHLAGFS